MKELIEEVIETKYQRLERLLVDDLKEMVEMDCNIHGQVSFTIGKFLKSQTVCKVCKKNFPLLHEDMLVFPLVKALTVTVADNKKQEEVA